MLARLERKLFAPEFRDGVSLLREILSEADAQFCNFSFGLFDGARCVGYLVAYIEDRSVFGRSEEVVYLRGLAILPAYRRTLIRFVRLLSELMSAYCPGAPVEAESVPAKADGWASLEGLLRHYGYALRRREPLQEQVPGLTLEGMRWEMQADAAWVPDQPLPLPSKRWRVPDIDRPIEISVIDNPRQWLSLQDQWDELLRATPGYTMFQSFNHLTWRVSFNITAEFPGII